MATSKMKSQLSEFAKIAAGPTGGECNVNPRNCDRVYIKVAGALMCLCDI